MVKNNSYKIPEFDFHPTQHKEMKMFELEEYSTARDILEIGFSFFELEKIIKTTTDRNFQISRFSNKHQAFLKEVLSDLFSFVLLEKVSFEFSQSNKKLKNEPLEIKYQKPKTVVLFSGGIDSYSGIEWANDYFNKDIIGVFCAHSDQTWSIHITNKIIDHIFTSYKVHVNKIYVPPIKKGGYSQLRGFLYILAAGAYMEVINAKNLILSECGPTMYQPKFGLFDSITMTTHPVVVESAFVVLRELLGRPINLFLPFENLTKAEVIAEIGGINDIPYTHSCVSQRFGTHDGTCYGCIIRRLGCIVAGVNDVNYKRDPISDEKANADNLLSLLSFSLNLLSDFNNMPYYQTENIESYNKLNLFYRFALDNFAALLILKKQRIRFTSAVDNIFKDCLEIIKVKKLEQRIENVRNKKFKINKTPVKY
jgi:7-cyano-7-deazaguanine synthase in queuosine biosynthesis